MRKLLGILALGGLVLAGGTAAAAPVQTTGTITVGLGALGSFTVQGAGTVQVTGSGGAITATTTGGAVISDATAIAVPSGLAVLTAVQTIFIDPNDTTAVTKIVLQPGVGQAAGTFASAFVPGTAGGVAQTCPEQACVAGGGVGGVMPISGDVTVFVSLFGSPIPAQLALADFNIGQGGPFTATVIVSAVGSGAPFTTGTGQASTIGGNVTSAAGSGAPPITFVSPTAVDIPAVTTSLPIFTSFSLSGIGMAVPEPGTLLLLGAGMAGLVVATRRRD